MTAATWPDHLLSLEEFIELPEPHEYGEAGIPHYWVIDLDEPLSLAAYHHAGEFGYQQAPAVTRVFETAEPFPLRIDLTELTDGPARQYGKETR